MRRSPLKRSAPKRSQPRRDWKDARAKVDAEGCCRNCKQNGIAIPIEAAHTLGRVHDRFHLDGSRRKTKTWKVEAVRIVPLCQLCHLRYDAHQMDLWRSLKPDERAQAVLDAGSLESARRRLAPTLYRKAAA